MLHEDTRLTGIWVQDRYEPRRLRLDWSNDFHMSEIIDDPGGPREIVRALRNLADMVAFFMAPVREDSK